MAFFCFFWFLLGVLCIRGVLALLVSLLCTRLGLLRCASCWTCPLGRGRWRHYLCNPWGEYLKIHNAACMYYGSFLGFFIWKPYMLASVGQPSLHGYYACMVCWNKGALQRNCRQKQNKTSFSPFWGFSAYSEFQGRVLGLNPTKRFWGSIFWHFWARRARHPGPPSQPHHVSLEFHNVGGWLTHGDLALDAGVDFLAVAEHRLIPARVRSEWSRLRRSVQVQCSVDGQTQTLSLLHHLGGAPWLPPYGDAAFLALLCVVLFLSSSSGGAVCPGDGFPSKSKGRQNSRTSTKYISKEK